MSPSESPQEDIYLERSLIELPEDLAEPQENYLLYLYVAGNNPNSSYSIHQLKKICQEHLPDRHEIHVIDIYERPDLAESARIVATPTLVKKLPPPLRKFIGDLSDKDQILIGLDIGFHLD